MFSNHSIPSVNRGYLVVRQAHHEGVADVRGVLHDHLLERDVLRDLLPDLHAGLHERARHVHAAEVRRAESDQGLHLGLVPGEPRQGCSDDEAA